MKRIFKKKARDGQDFCVAKKAENTPATEPLDGHAFSSQNLEKGKSSYVTVDLFYRSTFSSD
jgi:hypothetical protein